MVTNVNLLYFLKLPLFWSKTLQKQFMQHNHKKAEYPFGKTNKVKSMYEGHGLTLSLKKIFWQKILKYALSDTLLLNKASWDIFLLQYELNIFSCAIKWRQQHIAVESFLLKPIQRMSQSTNQQGQCSLTHLTVPPERNQQFAVLIPIYIS